MKKYFRRWSVLASLAGLVVAILAFLPALAPVMNWESSKRDPVLWGIVAVFALWLVPLLATFFQQIEIENEVTDAVDRSTSDLVKRVDGTASHLKILAEQATVTAAAMEHMVPLWQVMKTYPVCASKLAEVGGHLDVVATRFQNQPRILTYANLIISDALQRADDLTKGRFQTPFWSCHILEEEAAGMSKYLIGYSPLVSEDELRWWDTAAGQKFLQVNGRMRKDGRQITRIFCVERVTDEIGAMLKQHAALDIEVVIVRPDDIPPWMPVDQSAAVVDGRIAYHAVRGQDGLRNVWTYNEEDVRNRETILATLHGRGRLFPKDGA